MGRQPSAKPTSFDIAYLAGVSQPTVSRALRGSKSVSAATRANIERIARELNYTVDKNASSLRSPRTHTLALLFFEDPTPDERSEERRVGEEGVRTCRSRWSRESKKKKTKQQ